MRLDGVVTLVDAKHCELHLDEEKPEGKINETVEQIAMADRILLNKIDLVNEGDLDRVEGRIRAINSLAEVCVLVSTPFGGLDVFRVVSRWRHRSSYRHDTGCAHRAQRGQR